ncbi:alpha/beta fold hydrolase [Halopseudomonas pelagia]|uniref:Alpha/beta hydrolase n=1 Tax=Halopseudomonas pelagia TaxID=553151 RepID=A0AA91U045_9GAMM|nr:alpha/beta hydrolase [Halopseudomonas pelagia]PCC98169.1 alpha/beta hydrolase [Halopseudomonas pelagia]QFY57309.1 alpha/beta hydrolase [Halopseudomonas pelagia]
MKSFTSFDGVEICYRQWNSRAKGVPVILQHGYIANARVNWVLPGIVFRLTMTGHRVIALDARGHGRSDKPQDAEAYGESRMARDVSCLIDELRLEEVDLVGYSMGATVALLVAAQDQRIRKLVIGGIGAHTLSLGRSHNSQVKKKLAAALLTPNRRSIKHPALLGFRLFADFMRADRNAMAAQALAFHSRKIPFERITNPTLVIAGRNDPLAIHPEKLQAALPDAQLCITPGNHSTALMSLQFKSALVTFLS